MIPGFLFRRIIYFIVTSRNMGKKRRASTSGPPSESATKKLFVAIGGSQREFTSATSALSNPDIVDSGKFKGEEIDNDIANDPISTACDAEEHGLIESTMIELLVQRGPEKTC